ncbi:arylsulfatase [Marasmitruncus massiliensis]|uniref:arylsulfatase n=1 Tax=Marasmitruncus massiliensis TaxID=1944642 RepID=UPI001A9A6A8C|nr:arylsulfatase [Marasmitruncus massiliensis]
MNQAKNILLILCDDMGYSDIGCYGGLIETPNIDRLAWEGTRYTNFYNCPRCAPSRASLLTGLHPHQTGIGILTYNDGPLGYPGTLNQQCMTIAQVLTDKGYRSYLSGKWHLSGDTRNENENWPLHRGFDHHFGTLAGSGSYYNPHTLMRDNQNIEQEIVGRDFYYTDAITDNAVKFIREHRQAYPESPFFQYVAYTSPHWPLQAPENVIAKYKGHFDEGWDVLRTRKLQQMVKLGIINQAWAESPRDPQIPAWKDIADKEWYARCMEVYAAQLDVMDQGIGRILSVLEEMDELDNTLIFFLSDNGGCNEEIKAHPQPGADIIPYAWTREKDPILVGNHKDHMPGGEDTFQTYTYWANLSNAPFRLYKSWVHEGGIATPLIVRGADAKAGEISHRPGQITDIAATIYEVAGINYPQKHQEQQMIPLEGCNLFAKEQEGRPLFWEHQGNGGVRKGKWKAVCEYPKAWELYDLEADRCELNDLALTHKDVLEELVSFYYQWAQRCGVLPRDRILSIPGRKTVHNPFCDWMI